MAFEAKTIDEETTGLVDSYDAAIAPKSIWRNNNNKLYLVFKSIGAGFSKIRDVVLALKYRFDPRFCDIDDLESAMFVTGEVRIGGKTSMLRVIAYNGGDSAAILREGVYLYTSADGEIFTFTAPEIITIASLDYKTFLFTSTHIGAWPVADALGATITRQDGQIIDGDIVFDIYDNSGALGRSPETDFEVRQRLITDTTRQDSLRELELAIKALPTIFECNLIFNSNDLEPVVLEDGTILAPKELAIVVTGVPNQDLADVVMSRTFYKTHMNAAEDVVWYYNTLLAGGRYPVYYMTHKKQPFYLTLHYKYDRQKMQKEAVDAAFSALLRKYRFLTTHIDEVNEPLLYRELENHGIPGVELKKIYIQVMSDGNPESVASVVVPKLMIPELIDIAYFAEDIGG